MPINYNQLLKSLEIGSDHFKVFICFLCSTLVLYPLLFVSLPFLRDISIYQQLLFVSGCSVIYTGLGILFSAPAIKYPGMFYLPILVLGCISVVFYIKKVLQSSDSMLIMLLILLISTYSCLFVGGIIAVVVKTKKSKKSKPIPKKEIVKAKRYSGEHWQYDEAVSYTKKDNDALNEYHHKLPVFYAEYGHSLEDEELDEFVYGYPISQTA